MQHKNDYIAVSNWFGLRILSSIIINKNYYSKLYLKYYKNSLPLKRLAWCRRVVIGNYQLKYSMDTHLRIYFNKILALFFTKEKA